jgi:hypothetical protein
VVSKDGFFDTAALWAAMVEKRHALSMSWRQAVDDMNSRSSVLDERLGFKHPLAVSTVGRLENGPPITCQHALAYLKWIDATPESFMVPSGAGGVRLPDVGPDRRLRWDIPAVDIALRRAKTERKMTWAEIAAEVGSQPGPLSGLARSRYGIEMTLAMRICAWLDRPASSFTIAAEW